MIGDRNYPSLIRMGADFRPLSIYLSDGWETYFLCSRDSGPLRLTLSFSVSVCKVLRKYQNFVPIRLYNLAKKSKPLICLGSKPTPATVDKGERLQVLILRQHYSFLLLLCHHFTLLFRTFLRSSAWSRKIVVVHPPISISQPTATAKEEVERFGASCKGGIEERVDSLDRNENAAAIEVTVAYIALHLWPRSYD